MRRTRTSTATLIALALAAALALPATAQDSEPTITTQVIESFDGTEIFSTLFLPAGASATDPVPLVMKTHGWGGSGETEVRGTLQALLEHGYAVLTWDQRGFGKSGGDAMVDKPEYEGKDAAALLDWVVANVPEIAMESPGDPLVGMNGGSYAGGIQMALTSFDDRIDALTPEITWTDLRYALYEGGVINIGWGQLLFGAGFATAFTGGLNPSNETGIETGSYPTNLFRAEAEGAAINEWTDETVAFFGASSLAEYGQTNPVAIPTMVLQGSVDTLFDLTDGWNILQHVAAQGAPTKYVVFCGGHVTCPTSYGDAGDRAFMDAAIVAWFDRYLKGRDVDTGAPVDYRTNDAEWRTAQTFGGTRVVTADVDGSVVQSGAPQPDALGGETYGGLVLSNPNEAGDPTAATFEVLTADGGPLELLGQPSIDLDVTVNAVRSHVFVKLVHREAGQVVNFQENALRIDGPGTQTVTIPMSGIAYTLPEGDHLDLQVTTSSLMHVTSRQPGQVAFTGTVSVPVAPAAAAAPAPAPEPAPAPSPAPLPATGGGMALIALVLVGGAIVLRRQTG